jgi:hypothetical protein
MAVAVALAAPPTDTLSPQLSALHPQLSPALVNLTHYGEPRSERQAASSRNQENYLSCQLR